MYPVFKQVGIKVVLMGNRANRGSAHFSRYSEQSYQEARRKLENLRDGQDSSRQQESGTLITVYAQSNSVFDETMRHLDRKDKPFVVNELRLILALMDPTVDPDILRGMRATDVRQMIRATIVKRSIEKVQCNRTVKDDDPTND